MRTRAQKRGNADSQPDSACSAKALEPVPRSARKRAKTKLNGNHSTSVPVRGSRSDSAETYSRELTKRCRVRAPSVESVDADEGPGKAPPIAAEFLDGELLPAVPDDQMIFKFPGIIRRAVAAEVEAMSDSELAGLTREKVEEITKSIYDYAFARFKARRDDEVDFWFDELTGVLNLAFVAALKELGVLAMVSTKSKSKELQEKLRKYTAGVRRQGYLEKLKFRVMVSNEFVRFRRRVNDELQEIARQGQSESAATSGSTSMTSRRSRTARRRSSATPRRRETLAESAAAVSAYESSPCWQRLISLLARIDDRYASLHSHDNAAAASVDDDRSSTSSSTYPNPSSSSASSSSSDGTGDDDPYPGRNDDGSHFLDFVLLHLPDGENESAGAFLSVDAEVDGTTN